MEKRLPGRPRSEYPYACGPYKHGTKWRLIIVTGRSRAGRQCDIETFADRDLAVRTKRELERKWAGAGKTVEVALKAHLDQLTRKGNKSSTVTTTRHQLEALLDLDMQLVDLNRRRAQELYDALVDTGVAVDTHRNCLAKGRGFGKFCVLQGWIRVNPFIDIEGVGRRKKGKEQLGYDETRTYEDMCVKQWEEHKDRGAVAGLLALMFSMRVTEVSQLKARDVDNKGRILRIAETESKTEASKRMAQVPPRYRPILLELAKTPATADGHLFAMDRGKVKGQPANRGWVLRNVRRLMALAGVKVITAHGLRGTSATIGAAHSGAQVMSTALGHTSVSMTKDHYIDSDSVADSQAQRFADMLTETDDE
jgi:integrase